MIQGTGTPKFEVSSKPNQPAEYPFENLASQLIAKMSRFTTLIYQAGGEVQTQKQKEIARCFFAIFIQKNPIIYNNKYFNNINN